MEKEEPRLQKTMPDNAPSNDEQQDASAAWMLVAKTEEWWLGIE
jgi:hypothetical protein